VARKHPNPFICPKIGDLSSGSFDPESYNRVSCHKTSAMTILTSSHLSPIEPPHGGPDSTNTEDDISLL
jgi:hypothetical protein